MIGGQMKSKIMRFLFVVFVNVRSLESEIRFLVIFQFQNREDFEKSFKKLSSINLLNYEIATKPTP